MKIQFIHPSNDEKHLNLQNGYKSFPPPIGLETLASYLNFNNEGLIIEIFDGNTVDFNTIVTHIDADIIGISDWFTNHNNVIKIAKKLRLSNPRARIIVGGPNASNLGERILINHGFIDYVVYGDGEEAINGIVKGLPIEKIPNLWYRNKMGSVEFTFMKTFNLNASLPYSLDHLVGFNLEKYDSRLKSYLNSFSLTPMPISSIRGCIKAQKFGACSFCSINANSKIKIKSAENFWKQIIELNTNYGINKFFETGDSFVIGNYPELLLEAKPANLNVHLRIYANIETLNSIKIATLAKIGVKEIFIGIENIDKEILSFSNKDYNSNQIISILNELEDYGISPFLSFILGLPGETMDSMLNNHSFAKYLSYKFEKMNHISFNAGVPLIGSSWFNTLQSNSTVRDVYVSFTGKSLLTDDDLDYELLFLLSLKDYTSISFIQLYEVLNTPLHPRLNNNIAGFGCIAENIIHSKKHISFAYKLWPEMNDNDYLSHHTHPSTFAIRTNQPANQKLQKSLSVC